MHVFTYIHTYIGRYTPIPARSDAFRQCNGHDHLVRRPALPRHHGQWRSGLQLGLRPEWAPRPWRLRRCPHAKTDKRFVGGFVCTPGHQHACSHRMRIHAYDIRVPTMTDAGLGAVESGGTYTVVNVSCGAAHSAAVFSAFVLCVYVCLRLYLSACMVLMNAYLHCLLLCLRRDVCDVRTRLGMRVT